MQALRQAVFDYAGQHANGDGLAVTPVAGLRMMRVDIPAGPLRSIYRPLVCLVLQGSKQMTIGRTEQIFSAGQSVIVGADVPVIGQIVEAAAREPYLAVAIELDAVIMQEVALEMGSTVEVEPPAAPLFVETLDDTIIDCAMRLMRLLDHPQAVDVVRPAIMRELHYWLLNSENGPALRSLSVPGGHGERIARAVDILRSSFSDPIPVESLAAAANLSPSAFHRHFKALTSLSPLQFQKQLRLIEARRLMLAKGYTATQAAGTVGYESASQFSREYSRMFGTTRKRESRNEAQAAA
ncbi:AraC family transcriptional regulator [Aurantimonas endophytica]|uniref:AraC-like DNA-binding protein n=1 Tax=Aurantimonas endophytica TaxID=1522175 RepID=A0A7W6MRX2_9HYPH|nr:AraC family transcriptional regulator [Aurantimonas endophytica]MBB4005535.1 AraC-like DNA-binding protein [Aurantimonas endophytica]MCO6406493.1 helix-turn-helix domain-containing protein [Aurantimonas endophytica]